MKIIIIGAVAAGTSAAAKARRNNENAEIKIFEMDSEVSYSACGLPYYLGDEIDSLEQLVPRNAAFFKKKYNVDIFTGHQVLSINPELKSLEVKNLSSAEVFTESYDKLVLATGATPLLPAIKGIDKHNVFVLRNVSNAAAIKKYLVQAKPQRALVIGSGFIGLEMVENLKALGLEVTVVEREAHLMKPLDHDVAKYLQDILHNNGVQVYLSDAVMEFAGAEYAERVVLKSGAVIETDLVIVAAGIRPNVELAKQAGVELGVTGAIKVNNKMETSMPDVYACGDCAESYSLITNKNFYRPLGSTANKMGRIAGDQVTGGDLQFRGILGTGIFKIFDSAVAQTGLTEQEALQEGYEVAVCHNIKPDKPDYFHGKEMLIKAVADRNSGRLLGAQIVGKSGVDKRIDVFATAITFGAKVQDLFHLDLAYAPPFSTTKDPVMYTGMILSNDLEKDRKLITPQQLAEKIEGNEPINIIDARVMPQYQQAHVDCAVCLPHEILRESIDSLDKDKLTVTYCNKGVTGNAAQNILINNGFKQVYNLSGGYKNWNVIVGTDSSAILKEDKMEKKSLVIDFLFLDLEVCTRCQGTDTSLDEAIAEVAKVLEATDVEVVVNKINVISRELAIKHRFISSPTIRVNGRDIQMDVKESLCESCGDLCGEEVDCRVWVYRGEEYAVPPKAMIIEAILKEVYGGNDHRNTAEDYSLPANLERFYAAMTEASKETKQEKDCCSAASSKGNCC